ncbi:MAG: RsmB/NOP family class I SAM-dependent RNA methyltransferase [Candidatus Altiarchaeales archaeon]|nr:RsmB/NOP family class I SAM-dependent RNA methyltransferase [Candidatus Altiarchaeales archaeon]
MKKNSLSLLEERFQALAEDSERFFEYSRRPLRKSIRVNALKTTKDELAAGLRGQNFALTQVPWSEAGFWVEGKGLSETLEYFLGHYYIQEASSLIPPEILRPTSQDVVLDVCAAPGGKTTHLSALMENQGCILANEIDFKRRAALRFNLSKYGVLNVAITSMDFAGKIECKTKFSKILLDAPCSCEGQFRKNPKALEQWSLNKILRHSGLQKKLITNAIELLDTKGVLIYSTCTLAPEENEEVIDHILSKHGNIKIEPLGKQAFKYRSGVAEWGGKKYSPEVKNCARIYPQDNDTEGFFIARIRKCGN